MAVFLGRRLQVKGVWRPFSVVVGKGPLMGELRKGKRIEGF